MQTLSTVPDTYKRLNKSKLLILIFFLGKLETGDISEVDRVYWKIFKQLFKYVFGIVPVIIHFTQQNIC